MEIIARAQVSQLMFNYKHYEEKKMKSETAAVAISGKESKVG